MKLPFLEKNITIPWKPINVGTSFIAKSSGVIDSLSSISILAHLLNFCLNFFIAHACPRLSWDIVRPPTDGLTDDMASAYPVKWTLKVVAYYYKCISLYVICTKLFVFLCFFSFLWFFPLETGWTLLLNWLRLNEFVLIIRYILYTPYSQETILHFQNIRYIECIPGKLIFNSKNICRKIDFRLNQWKSSTLKGARYVVFTKTF